MPKMRRFFLLLAASTLWAHPHVFVDVYPKIMPDSIQIRWVFDEMNSNMLIMDYDSNADHKLDASEQKAIQNDIFDTLSEYGYYTYFFDHNTLLSSVKAYNFSAAIEGDRLAFMFTLKRPLKATQIRFYDTENMTGYSVKEAFVKAANGGKSYPVHTKDYDYYYGYILELQ